MEFLILDHGIFPLGGNQLVLPREPEGVIGSFCLLCKGVYFGRFAKYIANGNLLYDSGNSNQGSGTT